MDFTTTAKTAMEVHINKDLYRFLLQPLKLQWKSTYSMVDVDLLKLYMISYFNR